MTHDVLHRAAHGAVAADFELLARRLFAAALREGTSRDERRALIDLASSAAAECETRLGWARALREEMTE
jgi:hypothetical protein